jgi:RING finger and SPRY domain-containing protein 1
LSLLLIPQRQFQESVLRLALLFGLSADRSDEGRKFPMQQRNVCVVLGCIAEKMAGPNSIAILTKGTLDYLLANLASPILL